MANVFFYDDCGAWANVRGYNSVIVENNPKQLHEKMARYVIVSVLPVRIPCPTGTIA